VVRLVEHGKDDLMFGVRACESFIEGKFLCDHFVWKWLICFIVAREQRENGGISREVLHQD
jgi:hypothetical protein